MMTFESNWSGRLFAYCLYDDIRIPFWASNFSVMMIFDRLSSWWYSNRVWASDCFYDDIRIKFEWPIEFERPIVCMMTCKSNLSSRLSLWWYSNPISASTLIVMMIFEPSLSIWLSSWWYLYGALTADCHYDNFWMEFERPIVFIMIFESNLSGRLSS